MMIVPENRKVVILLHTITSAIIIGTGSMSLNTKELAFDSLL
jgi:hypothetical protein